MALSPSALKLLDLIEYLEMKSLAWGFANGSLSEEETRDLIGGGDEAEDALEELIDAHLVVELLSVTNEPRYRSRFAEATRLLAANRQLFANKPWQSAPRLVADFRIDRRPRRFPIRDRQPENILSEHGQKIAPTSLRESIWKALTGHFQLAAFQERATVRLADLVDDGGTIVTAGTGSGKTLAFYLPALLAIGEAIDAKSWVKALAIYPRIELLKDQFAEAFRMARSIDSALADHGRRGIRIGALFGAIPNRASEQQLREKKWRRRGRDWVCPWINCPECNADMVWRDDQLRDRREQLECSNSACGFQIDETQIALTRQSMQKSPPDILFTTTEMLNQRMSDHWMSRLLGFAADRKPFLALLDEVHTYEGTSGAQAALTLRRWRNLLGTPIHWVGLSATLGDANRFFSELTGAPVEKVVCVSPALDEFVEEGAEYQILLRGDPASRASLLSTTIQTSMLVARVLDPPHATDVSGAFGRRAFLFTDDLDVTNRLFDDLRDAEAYTIYGKPDPESRPLAALRAADGDSLARDLEGQRWRICEDIGHPLDQRLVVGRTTSQDSGVLADANVIVATSSLEVGFNDPYVGAVIQHKGPRSMASFLQRKGRAGRSRDMRPITVTVLSDYGRDRALYQSYEQLFEPTLDAQTLPIENPYVLKMQAAFALIDWLSQEIAGGNKAWAWDYLSRPQAEQSDASKIAGKEVVNRLASLVQGDEAAIDKLRSHLIGALSIDEETADSLLWEPPRALLLEVVPTLLRRLFTEWKLAFPADGVEHDLFEAFHPLPEFVPRNLFSDLSLPEVRIIIPPADVNSDERTDTMPVLQALNQLAPGRVTRRFAFERGALSHWVPVDPSEAIQERRITDFAEEHEFVGSFVGQLNDGNDATEYLVFRPWTIRLAKVARTEALPSSNSRLNWRTDIVASGDPLKVPISPRSRWRKLISNVEFYLHRFRANASVRRFAPSAFANVRTLDDEHSVSVNFRSDDGRPAAIGFEIEVDGFRLDLSLPPLEELRSNLLTDELLRDSRFAYLRDRFRSDDQLPPELNIFQRDWIFQILTAALANQAAIDGGLSEAAMAVVSDEQIDQAFKDVMDEYFGAVTTPPLGNEDDDEGEGDEADDAEMPTSTRAVGRLQRDLAAKISQPDVRERIRKLAREFFEPEVSAFETWIQRLVLETVGEAILQACMAAAPREATLDNLLVDLKYDPVERVTSVWVTETTIGGAGALQSFAERFTSEPSVFFDSIEAALAATDLELVDSSLHRVVELACNDTEVGSLFNKLRETNSHAASAALWRDLTSVLVKRGGVDLSHATVVAINSRLLRHGVGPGFDQLLYGLTKLWRGLEDKLQISIGLREFAYVVSRDSDWSSRVHKHIAAILPMEAADQISVFSIAYGMLWPRESEVRRTSLQAYHPYREARTLDPGVVRQLLFSHEITEVRLSQDDWFECLLSALAEQGTCRLIAESAQVSLLRSAIVRLCATPVDVGVLQFFPVVERLEHATSSIHADLILREHT